VPIPRQPAVAAVHPDVCPIAAQAAGEVLSLPLHPGMRAQDVRDVATAVGTFQPRIAATSKGQ
jgi:perosamine synthetase